MSSGKVRYGIDIRTSTPSTRVSYVSDRDHRDALTSRQGHSTFPQTFLKESLLLRLQSGGPIFLQRLTRSQSLAMTIPVNKSNRHWKAMTKAEECSQDSLSD